VDALFRAWKIESLHMPTGPSLGVAPLSMEAEMDKCHNPEVMVRVLQTTSATILRRNGPDLSGRQLGVFLTSYLQKGTATVRSLAADLNLPQSILSRVLDRLSELKLARRSANPADPSNALVRRTPTGRAFLRDLSRIMAGAAAAHETGRLNQSSRYVQKNWLCPSPKSLSRRR
jgi:DNA-binding MarR family transcriptional regulator